MNDFKGKSLSELKEILISLKLYKNLSNKLWNRGKKIFTSISENTNIFKIEYFENCSKDDALNFWLIVYKKIFGVSPKKEEINLVSNLSLEWWIRVYKDDNLVDLSFKKVSESLR